MEHNVPESPDDLEAEKDTHEAQADGVGPFDDVPDNRRAEQGDAGFAERDGATADEASVDGRLSGLPPSYDDDADDPSAQEAAIHRRENPDEK